MDYSCFEWWVLGRVSPVSATGLPALSSPTRIIIAPGLTPLSAMLVTSAQIHLSHLSNLQLDKDAESINCPLTISVHPRNVD